MLAIRQWLWFIVIDINDILLLAVAHLASFVCGTTPAHIFIISVHGHILLILVHLNGWVHVVHHLLIPQMLIKHGALYYISIHWRARGLSLLIYESFILILGGVP